MAKKYFDNLPSVDIEALVNTLDIPSLNARPVGFHRIAFHYNYENDTEKLKQVKQLGFNILWIYKQASWTQDTSRVISFLDVAQRYGLMAIFQVNRTVLSSADPSVEQAFISNIESHPALLGFSNYDEPYQSGVSKTNQETVYSNIKAVTDKNVYMVVADMSPYALRTYYTPNAFDVLLLDTYITDNNQGRQEIIETIVSRISSIKNFAQQRKPKQLIPVFPFFSDGVYAEISYEQIKAHMDAWRPYMRTMDYAVFAHDVSHSPSQLDSNLDTSDFLRKIVTTLPGYLISNEQKETSLMPMGYQLNESYVASTNLKYNNNDTPKLGPLTLTPGVIDITLRVTVNAGASLLIACANVINKQDADTRVLKFEVSYDGSTWALIGDSINIGSKSNGATYVKSISINPDVTACYVKYSLDASALVGNQYAEYWGFMSLAAVTV